MDVIKKWLTILEIISIIGIFASIFIIKSQHTEDHSISLLRQIVLLGSKTFTHDDILTILNSSDKEKKASLEKEIKTFLSKNRVRQVSLYARGHDNNADTLLITINADSKQQTDTNTNNASQSLQEKETDIKIDGPFLYSMDKNGNRLPPQTFLSDNVIIYHGSGNNILCEIVFSSEQLFKTKSETKWALTLNAMFAFILFLCTIFHVHYKDIKGKMLKKAINKRIQ